MLDNYLTDCLLQNCAINERQLSGVLAPYASAQPASLGTAAASIPPKPGFARGATPVPAPTAPVVPVPVAVSLAGREAAYLAVVQRFNNFAGSASRGVGNGTVNAFKEFKEACASCEEKTSSGSMIDCWLLLQDILSDAKAQGVAPATLGSKYMNDLVQGARDQLETDHADRTAVDSRSLLAGGSGDADNLGIVKAYIQIKHSSHAPFDFQQEGGQDSSWLQVYYCLRSGWLQAACRAADQCHDLTAQRLGRDVSVRLLIEEWIRGGRKLPERRSSLLVREAERLLHDKAVLAGSLNAPFAVLCCTILASDNKLLDQLLAAVRDLKLPTPLPTLEDCMWAKLSLADCQSTEAPASTRAFPTTVGFQVTSGFAVTGTSFAKPPAPVAGEKQKPSAVAVVSPGVAERSASSLSLKTPSKLVGWQGLYAISNSGASGVLGDKVEDETSSPESKYKIEICCTLHAGAGAKRMVKSVVRGLKACQEPEKTADGMGGTYFFMNENGRKVAIMKPCDEEPLAPNNPKGYVGRSLGDPGWKPTVRVGEAAMREVAAFLLDYDGFARVPCTVLVRARHPVFHYEAARLHQSASAAELTSVMAEDASCQYMKLGSLQEFVHHECDTTEMGPSRFTSKDVHRIGILDLRLFNTDRHAGNMLVKVPTGSSLNLRVALDQPKYELVPIDHGFCLPEALENPYFEWQHWPQALLPFEEEELAYICSLNVAADQELLQKELPNLRPECLKVLEVATTLLQRCAVAGLTLAEIAAVVTRPFDGNDDDPSQLEIICSSAAAAVQNADSIIDEGSELSSLSEEEEILMEAPSDSSALMGLTADGVSLVARTHTATEEDMLFELEEERGSRALVSSSTDSCLSPMERCSIGSEASGGMFGVVAGEARLKAPQLARSLHVTANSTLWRNVKGRNAVGRKVTLDPSKTPAYPPPVVANAPGNVNTLFSNLDKQQWQLFMEVFVAEVGDALKKGAWKRDDLRKTKVAMSCHY